MGTSSPYPYKKTFEKVFLTFKTFRTNNTFFDDIFNKLILRSKIYVRKNTINDFASERRCFAFGETRE